MDIIEMRYDCMKSRVEIVPRIYTLDCALLLSLHKALNWKWQLIKGMIMERVNSRVRSVAGITLVETLIALFLTGLVIAAIFGVYINQHKNWMIQEEITGMQQNGRSAIDELTRCIRMAGYHLPLGINPVEGSNTDPDTVVVTFCPGECKAVVEQDMTHASDNLHCDGHDLTCFKEGQWLYINDVDSGGGEFFQVSGINAGSFEIGHAYTPLSRPYNKGAVILPVQSMKYYIDNSDSTCPRLMLQLLGQNPAVYAEYVEDLQLKYRMKNGTVSDVPTVPSNVIEILMTVTTRSAQPDPDMQDNPYGRRSYSSRVNLRNMDIRINAGFGPVPDPVIGPESAEEGGT